MLLEGWCKDKQWSLAAVVIGVQGLFLPLASYCLLLRMLNGRAKRRMRLKKIPEDTERSELGQVRLKGTSLGFGLNFGMSLEELSWSSYLVSS